MPVMDRKKIRKDVLKFMNANLALQMESIQKYFQKPENQNTNIARIWKNVSDKNQELFKTGDTNLQKYFGVLTRPEMVAMAQLLRYVTEDIADSDQKEHPLDPSVKLEKVDIAGMRGEWQRVPGAPNSRAVLYIHGGGMIMGSIKDHRVFTVEVGKRVNSNILSIEYRLAPEHVFPAAVEDCVAAYKWMLKQFKPRDIMIAGDSAGGYLTLTTLLKIKQEGIPMPCAAMCFSPATDYSQVDDDFFAKAPSDPVLADIGLYWWIEAYVGNADLTNSLVSPVLGDLKGFPPLLIQASSTEMLYSQSKRFATRAASAGVDVTLQEWPDMIHVFHAIGYRSGWPEVEDAFVKISQFAKRFFM